MLDLLILIPLMIDSGTAARNDAKNRVDTWDLAKICGTNSNWSKDEQVRLKAELAPLPHSSLIRGKLTPDWLRMRDGNRNCRGEKVPTK